MMARHPQAALFLPGVRAFPHDKEAFMKNTLTARLFPTVTNMIRLDHTHVMVTFHQYHVDSSPMVKEGLVKTACTALEVHAQLEEEIFYPALRAVTQNEALKKSVPEHDEMRRLIAELRSMAPTDAGYDDTFMELIRDVLHHVADEETVVLPEAERLLSGQLEAIGATMTKRRLALVVPRTGEIAINMAKAMPSTTIALIAAAIAGAGIATWHGARKRSRPF
jgi:hemerythrin superfamily protein